MRLPPALQAEVAVAARQPLRLLLERLLRRAVAATAERSERWMEAVLAAFAAAVILPAPPAQQAAAEQQLLAALAGLQGAAAAHNLLATAAQQAAGAATAQLRYRGSGSSSQTGSSGSSGLTPSPAERPCLLAEALEHLTSPACLEATAAAQLLMQTAEQQQRQQQADEQPPPLARLLHSPPTALEVELLCLAALLPSWETTLQRLAGLAADQQEAGSSDTFSCQPSPAVQQAMKLLCTACASQPATVLSQHPALLAEVCRRSFRFTAGLAPLLARQLAEAAGDTPAVLQAARWRAAHLLKHADHASDYLLAKLSDAAASSAEHGGAAAEQPAAAALGEEPMEAAPALPAAMVDTTAAAAAAAANAAAAAAAAAAGQAAWAGVPDAVAAELAAMQTEGLEVEELDDW